MDKGPDAFRTISEVADDLGLPQHVLRFWETRFPSIRPLKRGGGRRYYRPDDVDLLKGIQALLYGQGYTYQGCATHSEGEWRPPCSDARAWRSHGWATTERRR
jgi:DNA-binding transcriptional MerR regulator